MLQKISKYFLIYLSASLLVFTSACAPKKADTVADVTPTSQKDTDYSYSDEAKPTTLVPTGTDIDLTKYQAPKKIVNNHQTEIIIGSAELRQTKITYNSVEKKMTIAGHAAILDTDKKKVSEKYFSLTAVHIENESVFKLNDEIVITDNKMLVKAVAHCLALTKNKNMDCNHTVVDIYISYNKKIYSEQIEINKRLSTETPSPISNQPVAIEQPQQNENEDQLNAQQNEDSDEALPGRYQGSIGTIDLKELFSEIETNLPPKTKPAEPAEPLVTPTPAPTPVPTKKNETPIKPTLPNLKDKILSTEWLQTKLGITRQYNQAQGFTNAGRLNNATSLLTIYNLKKTKNEDHFEITSPERKKYYSTYEMSEMILRISRLLNKTYEKKLYVSNISDVDGGKLSPHSSHQNGLDVDIGYPTDSGHLKFPLVVKMSTREYYAKNYSIAKTYQLFKYLFLQNDIATDRLFVDKTIKKELCKYAIAQKEFSGPQKDVVKDMFENIQHVAGHGDHFHLRIKCSNYDSGCRNLVYKKMESCENIIK